MRQLLWIALLALTLSACLQSPTATTSPSPNATATVAITPTATLIPMVTLSAPPSPTPTALASPSETPSAANVSSVPSLSEVALRLEPVLNDVFNVSRVSKRKDTTFGLISDNVWSMGDAQGDYLYSVTLSNARVHWRPEELLEPAINASGVKNGFLSYSVGSADRANIMKCHGQRYELNLNLKSYARTWSTLDYQPLMRRIMSRIVDACPP